MTDNDIAPVGRLHPTPTDVRKAITPLGAEDCSLISGTLSTGIEFVVKLYEEKMIYINDIHVMVIMTGGTIIESSPWVNQIRLPTSRDGESVYPIILTL